MMEMKTHSDQCRRQRCRFSNFAPAKQYRRLPRRQRGLSRVCHRATGYQWQRKLSGSPAFVTIPGATISTYTTPPASASDDGTIFRSLVSKGATHQLSHEAVLSVRVVNSPTFAYDFRNLGGATIYGHVSVSNGVLEFSRLEPGSSGSFLRPRLGQQKRRGSPPHSKCG